MLSTADADKSFTGIVAVDLVADLSDLLPSEATGAVSVFGVIFKIENPLENFFKIVASKSVLFRTTLYVSLSV